MIAWAAGLAVASAVVAIARYTTRPAPVVAIVGATVVDARGKYLAPGLADMHVHLQHRNDTTAFRDAPLYLANGVTTVLNLSGDSAHLAWRSRLANGTLLGPTLYTAGRFINEPRVNTPDEVEREVRAQAAAGPVALDPVDRSRAQQSRFRRGPRGTAVVGLLAALAGLGWVLAAGAAFRRRPELAGPPTVTAGANDGCGTRDRRRRHRQGRDLGDADHSGLSIG